MEKYVYFSQNNEDMSHSIDEIINSEALCWYISIEEEIHAKVYYFNNKSGILKKELLGGYDINSDTLDKVAISENEYIINCDGKYDEICFLQIEELSEYIRIINILTESSDYVFRGQSNKGRKLNASIFRNNYHCKKELNIFKDVRRNRFEELKGEMFLDNLIYMQHYGIPTRLLDWSKNPLITLFFACLHSSGKSDADGKVFMHRPKIIYGFDSEIYESISNYLEDDFNGRDLSSESKKLLIDIVRESMPSMVFIESTYENDRLRAQNGLFSVNIDVKEYNIKTIREEIINRTKLAKDIDTHIIKEIVSIEDNDIENIYNSIESILDLPLKRNNIISIDDKEEFISQLKEMNYFSFDKQVKGEIDIYSNIINFVIPNNSKDKILSQLDKLNINSMTVYPDFSGFVDYIKGKYEKE